MAVPSTSWVGYWWSSAGEKWRRAFQNPGRASRHKKPEVEKESAALYKPRSGRTLNRNKFRRERQPRLLCGNGKAEIPDSAFLLPERRSIAQCQAGLREHEGQ